MKLEHFFLLGLGGFYIAALAGSALRNYAGLNV